MPIHVFLNYYDGAFRPRLHRRTHGARTVEALNQRFLQIYRAYADACGPGNVYLFRQEDLRHRAADVKAGLAAVLGLSMLPQTVRERVQNRSYSALAIRLFHPGTRRRFDRSAPEHIGMPSRRFRCMLRPLIRLRRLLIQHAFDKLAYVDWDLLEADNLRALIDAHYAKENAEIRRIADTTLQGLLSNKAGFSICLAAQLTSPGG